MIKARMGRTIMIFLPKTKKIASTTFAAKAKGIIKGSSPIYEKFSGDRYIDRKSTRLNSSHVKISYAVFCLQKKNTTVRSYHRHWRWHQFMLLLSATVECS